MASTHSLKTLFVKTEYYSLQELIFKITIAIFFSHMLPLFYVWSNFHSVMFPGINPKVRVSIFTMSDAPSSAKILLCAET